MYRLLPEMRTVAKHHCGEFMNGPVSDKLAGQFESGNKKPSLFDHGRTVRDVKLS
jgi:hypothetical protein